MARPPPVIVKYLPVFPENIEQNVRDEHYQARIDRTNIAIDRMGCQEFKRACREFIIKLGNQATKAIYREQVKEYCKNSNQVLVGFTPTK